MVFSASTTFEMCQVGIQLPSRKAGAGRQVSGVGALLTPLFKRPGQPPQSGSQRSCRGRVSRVSRQLQCFVVQFQGEAAATVGKHLAAFGV